MKFAIAILAVLPAVLAAPSTPATPAVRDVPKGPGMEYETWACACGNDKGETYVPGACLYYAGPNKVVDGQKYCVPGGSWTIDLPNPFTDALCSSEYPNYPKSVCTTARVCWYLGDYFKLCDEQ